MSKDGLSVFQIAEEVRKPGGLSIPPLQRGLVWNAARMEALWDSILRGIPIGAISIRNGEIFDGQQRTHAISVGLNGGCDQEDNEILWLDMFRDAKTRVRKFLFRTTSSAHPWGYQLTDDEVNNHLLHHCEQRIAVEWLRDNGYKWQMMDDVAERPRPFEFWPWTATLPVPFSVVVGFINGCRSDVTWEGFRTFVKECHSGKNWGRYFLSESETIKIDHVYWSNTIAAIRRLSEYFVPIVNADTIHDPDDEALYFKRMNVNGKEPDSEEVQYSMLKWYLPALKKLDELASGFKSPAYLAQLAMLYYSNTKKERKKLDYISTVSDKRIVELARDDAFSEFVEKKLSLLMKGADRLLGIDCVDGLLPWHRTRICQKSWQLYMYLMKASLRPEVGINYGGLALLIRLYAVDEKAVVRSLWTSASVRDALQKSFCDGTLRFPLYPEELEWMNSGEVVSGRNWYEAIFKWSNTEVGHRWSLMRRGFDHNGVAVEVLAYSCRRYMNKMFQGYDPSDPRWAEQNRPWDYDHVLPQAWIRGRRLYGNNFTAVCQHVLWSVGNSAPVPYAFNRSKNAYPPGENYPFGKDGVPFGKGNGLQLDIGSVAKYRKESRWFDDQINEDKIKNFVRTTAVRSWNIYADMFETLGMRSLLDLRQFDPARYRILFRVAATLGGELYAVSNGQRKLLEKDASDYRFLQRFVQKVQLCVTVGKVEVCYETDDWSGAIGWIGMKCVATAAEKDRALQKSIEATLEQSYEWVVNDPEWYAYRDIDGVQEAVLIDKMNQYIDRAKNL